MIRMSGLLRILVIADVDMEDDCVFNMISVVDREMNVYDRRLCLCLLARQIYGFYETGVLLAGTRVSRILGLYWCVMIAFV